jgi:hypothetical protein
MGRDAVERGTKEAPFAYVIPPRQNDPAAAAQLCEVLIENGLEARVSQAAVTTAGGRDVAAGSVVFLAAQPYRPFLIEMMERQRYPEVRQGPDTKEIFKPYDVTAWTLPLLMGVDWMRVDEPFQTSYAPAPMLQWRGTAPREDANWIAIPATSNQSFTIVNRLLNAGVPVERTLERFEASDRGETRTFAPGGFVAPAARSRSTLLALADSNHVEILGLDSLPAVRRAKLKAPRVGLYKPWAASMDEGWTRLVLDRHGFKYRSLDNAGISEKLHARFDVVVLPDVEKAVIVDGKPKSEDGPTYFEPLPPPYSGGIGKDGVANLQTFVQNGGTLVCLGSSCALPIEEFNLPVRDLVAKAKATEFSIPGTLVNLSIDNDHPLGFGMPKTCTAYVTGGPVFTTAVPGAGTGRSVVARYPEYADQVVASGWALGTDRVTGRSAIVEVVLGKGRVVLISPHVQHRAQTVGTYKLLFNAIYRGAGDFGAGGAELSAE